MLRLPPTRIDLKHEDRAELIQQAKERAQRAAQLAQKTEAAATTPAPSTQQQRQQEVRSRLGIQ